MPTRSEDRSLIGIARIRIPAVATTAAGALLHAIKGVVLLLGGPDLSLVPSMVTLFATGMVGLALLLLHERRSVPARVGLIASALAIAGGVVSIGYQFAGMAPEFTDSPAGVKVAYAVGTFAIVIGLLALAVAAWRSESLDKGPKTALVVAAVVWFPFEGLTEVLPDGWGLLFAGLAWLLVPWAISGFVLSPKTPTR